MKTAELLKKYVPSVKSIGGYANPYIGVESGDDVILKRVNKGYDAKTAREQLEKLTAAGLPVITSFLNGGRKRLRLSHAQKTAELYDGVNISMIEVSSLTLIPHTPLYYQKIFLSDHISMPFFAQVKLPEQTNELIAGIQKIIEDIGEGALRRHRDANPIM